VNCLIGGSHVKEARSASVNRVGDSNSRPARDSNCYFSSIGNQQFLNINARGLVNRSKRENAPLAVSGQYAESTRLSSRLWESLSIGQRRFASVSLPEFEKNMPSRIMSSSVAFRQVRRSAVRN
jgi:hypothetical protein